MATTLPLIKAAPTPQTVNVLSLTASVTDTNQSIDLQQVEDISIQAVYTDATPANKAFASTDVIIADDTVTIAAHGFVTGLKVQLTTSGTLPTGVVVLTNYFIIKVDANTIKFASSLANAVAGTAIDLTGAGAGNSSVNPVALGTSTFALYASNDNVNFSAIPTMTVTISATGSTVFGLGQPDYRYLCLIFTAPTAGALTLSAIANVRKTNVQA